MLDSPSTAPLVKSKLLTPIKVGILESWRLISLSYSDPLKHTQHLLSLIHISEPTRPY
mgnify:CR=1 FL=1